MSLEPMGERGVGHSLALHSARTLPSLASLSICEGEASSRGHHEAAAWVHCHGQRCPESRRGVGSTLTAAPLPRGRFSVQHGWWTRTPRLRAPAPRRVGSRQSAGVCRVLEDTVHCAVEDWLWGPGERPLPPPCDHHVIQETEWAPPVLSLPGGQAANSCVCTNLFPFPCSDLLRFMYVSHDEMCAVWCAAQSRGGNT